MRKQVSFIFLLSLALFVAPAAQAEVSATHRPASPADNDRLIKEYMSSKDISYIKGMLLTYSEADDAMLKDARRFAYLSGQFKNPHNPRKQLAKTASTAVCDKYECRKNPELTNKFMTISSGMWALDSLSKQDSKIKDAVASFLKENERMRKIYQEEGELFSNYWAITAMYIAAPDKVDSILTTYENLGPLDAEKAMKNLNTEKQNP